MNIGKKNISILFTGLYLLGMIVSAFILLNFRNELVYDFNVLAISDAEAADPAFNKLYMIIGLSFILGLVATYFSFKADENNIIYIEKKSEDENKKKQVINDQSGDNEKINKEELDAFIKQKKAEQPGSLDRLLGTICKQLEASQGAFYLAGTKGSKNIVNLKASYAMSIAEGEDISFEIGEGLIGQVAKEHKTLYLNDIPEGFVKIVSGLGQASPKYLLIIPVEADGQLKGVVEIAGFEPVKDEDISTLEKFLCTFGKMLNEQKTKRGDEQVVILEGKADIASKKIKKKKSEGK